jgi:hypothetical protein
MNMTKEEFMEHREFLREHGEYAAKALEELRRMVVKKR